MASQEAMIKRVRKGGTCSVKGLARQLGYLSRQDDPERETIPLVNAQRHQFNPGTADAVDPNDVWTFARRVYERSGRLPPDSPNGELANDLTIHFVISFPQGTDLDAAERAGRDWAENVFGSGYRNDQGFVERHDYVTAFHRHENDSAHPHMHVVVDRSPLGGGNLLTLHQGHSHWSYEAMRLEAVEAAANHGIELVATTRADRSLTERPMTDIQWRQFQRLLMDRPITLDEAQRRRDDAETVPYFDPGFDDIGLAPDDGDEPGGLEPADLRRGCTPMLLPEASDDDMSSLDLDDDNDDNDDGPPSDSDSNVSNNRPRTRSPTPSRHSGPSDDDGNDDFGALGSVPSQSQQHSAGKRKHADHPSDDPSGSASKRLRTERADRETTPSRSSTSDEATGDRSGAQDPAGTSLPLTARNLQNLQAHLQAGEPGQHDRARPAQPNAGAADDGVAGADQSGRRNTTVGSDQQPHTGQNAAGKRPRADEAGDPARKRARMEQPNAEPANNGRSGAASGNQPGPSHTQQNRPVRSGAEGESSRDPVQRRRHTALHRRRTALEALHAHRGTAGNIAGDAAQAWHEEDRRLLREARLALAEQRRAYAGMTNVTTRAQAAAARDAGHADAAQDVGNQAAERPERRRGRPAKGSGPDRSR